MTVWWVVTGLVVLAVAALVVWQLSRQREKVTVIDDTQVVGLSGGGTEWANEWQRRQLRIP